MSNETYPSVNMPLRKVGIFITRILINAVANVQVHGLENVPPDGALLMVTNHMSYLDPPVIGTTIPRMCYTLTAEKYRYHFFGVFMRIVGAIFVNRGSVDRRALDQSLAVLADGYMLIMAIEGTRSKTGELKKGKTGVAYIATKAATPIIPVVAWGTLDAPTAWKKLRRPEIVVRYGKPFSLPDGRARKEDLETYTGQIMVELANLLPDKHRGYYRDHPEVKPFVYPPANS